MIEIQVFEYSQRKARMLYVYLSVLFLYLRQHPLHSVATIVYNGRIGCGRNEGHGEAEGCCWQGAQIFSFYTFSALLFFPSPCNVCTAKIWPRCPRSSHGDIELSPWQQFFPARPSLSLSPLERKHVWRFAAVLNCRGMYLLSSHQLYW